jgi:8-oxo-dGTP diphosphatase
MIFKKLMNRPDRRANPVIGLLLFLVSMALLLVTGPFGFIYGLFYSLFTKGFRGGGEYLLKIAISIDQLGNVLMQHLLNALWIKKQGYPFGNRDETISSALGRNKQLGTLTFYGQAIDKFLDTIDPNHSLNSIDYYVEPSEAIPEYVCWVAIRDKRVLFLRAEGSTEMRLPGGERREGMADAVVLQEYVAVQLGIRLEPSTMEYLGVFERILHRDGPPAFIRSWVYTGPFPVQPVSLQPGLTIAWLHSSDRSGVSETDRLILDFLEGRGLLS